jgi:hypothetical protein
MPCGEHWDESRPPHLTILMDFLQLCSEIRHIMDESIWLRYRQSLAAANMVDSGCSALSTAERLEKLEQTEQSWSRLAWRHEDMYRVDQPWTGGGLRKIYIGK